MLTQIFHNNAYETLVFKQIKSKISSFLPASVTVHAVLCRTLSRAPNTLFLASGLICTVFQVSIHPSSVNFQVGYFESPYLVYHEKVKTTKVRIKKVISRNERFIEICKSLTPVGLASLLWDIGKQCSPRCDAAFCSVPSGAILFAQRNFIEK